MPRIAQRLACQPTAHWVGELGKVGIPCGPVNDLQAVFEDPQVRSRHMKITLAHPAAGSVDLVANPIKFSRTPARYTLPPPRLGEHTGEVLRDVLGLSETEIEKLKAGSVV
ncbi:MAG: CoA transferase [Candidimonas sp.]|nr:MAG: CoA transferase [Candidimonas sp.]